MRCSIMCYPAFDAAAKINSITTGTESWNCPCYDIIKIDPSNTPNVYTVKAAICKCVNCLPNIAKLIIPAATGTKVLTTPNKQLFTLPSPIAIRVLSKKSSEAGYKKVTKFVSDFKLV